LQVGHAAIQSADGTPSTLCAATQSSTGVSTLPQPYPQGAGRVARSAPRARWCSMP